jgi:crotonobetainyl-CoA:carnitine CoA-transferase CaiB-like acyl-CoA transferase
VFEAADGYMVIGIGTDDQWQKFCAAVSHTDWATDDRFRTNARRVEHRDELLALVHPLVRERTTYHWQELLATIGVPHGPVLSVDDALATPQVVARNMILPVADRQGRSYSLLGCAIHWQGEPAREAVAPPEIGEHSDEILREWLGYDETKIAELRRCGAVA